MYIKETGAECLDHPQNLTRKQVEEMFLVSAKKYNWKELYDASHDYNNIVVQ